MPNLDRNPQNGVQGTSYIYDFGTTANTRTAVSQKIRILAPSYNGTTALNQMGVLSSMSLNQSKTVDEVRGIGFGDKIAELVPSVTGATTGSLERALLYLCNLWQATGYAAGIDGPVRYLGHHKWPFDLEQQLVFSTLADADLNAANVGYRNGQGGSPGSYDGGVKAVTFSQVTPDTNGRPGEQRGHTAIITILEACWFTSWGVSYAKDSGIILETGDITISDIHDFASVYGEFLATGNDPTLGQLGSIRFAESGFSIASSGRGTGGTGTSSAFSQLAVNVPV